MSIDEFLQKACAAAQTAGHIFPQYAACEAALESGWGASALAVEANNLFGQKQPHPPIPGSSNLVLPTREFLHGAWLTVQANWARFPNWEACFRARMQVLETLSRGYPHYKAALRAKDGVTFIAEVSKSWSTDPQRAGKVLSVYDRHYPAFSKGPAA